MDSIYIALLGVAIQIILAVIIARAEAKRQVRKMDKQKSQ